MSTRRELLQELFQQLNQRQIPWCVLRNFENLYAESPSDVDLLTLPQHAGALLNIALGAGRQTGFRLVQSARFINHTLVFWDGTTRFVRIDVDTEQRWGRRPVLAAAPILATRRPCEEFFIPHPANEAAIILIQTLWQGKMSERYAHRLGQLQPTLARDPEASRLLAETFGLPESRFARLADPALLEAVAGAVRGSVWRQPGKTLGGLGFWLQDAGRLISRLRTPPGICLRCYGSTAALAPLLMENLAPLFPGNKSVMMQGNLPRKLVRRALFTGGLAIECWPDLDPAAVPSPHWWARKRCLDVPDFAAGDANAALPDATLESVARWVCEALEKQCEGQAQAAC